MPALLALQAVLVLMEIKYLQQELEEHFLTNNKNLAKKIKHLSTTAKIKHKWNLYMMKLDLITECQV